MGWHRGSGFAAVLALDDGAELLQSHAPLPYLQQGADDGPHHVAQETVGLDAEHQQTVLFKPTRLHDLAVVGLHLGMNLRETCKVLVLEKHVGSLLHLGNIQVAVEEVGIIDMKRVLRARDIIVIGARHGIETGMQLGCDLPDAIDDDVLGEESVHLMGQGFWVGDLLPEIEMGVIVPCMYARIGAAAARDVDRLSQLQAEALFHSLLDAQGVRLDLVAVIAAAIVSHVDEITRHRRK